MQSLLATRHSDGNVVNHAGTVEEIYASIDQYEMRIRAGLTGLPLLSAINAMALSGLVGSRHRTAEFTAKGASAKAKAKRKASRTARKANRLRMKGAK